ncbi:MAG: SnoaL-like domain-containing protein, partial [Maribacter sp.]|nr:SnoaL-like domain-containing protein [Maribacter sp.]
MKLSKKKEKELMPVYEAYWDYYLKGDAKAMQHLLDESYTQVGSAESEVFSTKKDAVQFLFDTIDQVAGKLEMRNRHTKIELQDNVVLIHELCDLYALTNKEWVFYSKFRASTLMQEKKEGWKITHQHSSFPDTKTEEGQNVAIDKIAEENSQLREAIKRRTFELEEKNRELEVESALERIRAQAVAMQQSSDLLDIVVTMRNEFTKLGHEAHYFWHMMWLPETYEKAMTSGDGSKIGFVMKLPRHMHGDIPLLAKWEKSKKPTIVYAMTTKEAIEYVDKMVLLGDFQNIDPQAPSHDDLKHIGGLTFFMARTTHGEIGYSLPGVVKNPPKEDIDILVKFAGAFDLAHQRFLDLQKAEAQARETQIELALEKVRTASMTMKKGEELAKVISVVFTQLKVLGIDSEGCGLNLYDNEEGMDLWMSGFGEDVHPKSFHISYFDHPYYEMQLNDWKKQKKYRVIAFEGDLKRSYDHQTFANKDFFKLPKDIKKAFLAKETTISSAAYMKYGMLEMIGGEALSEDQADILCRFAGVFEQAYTRFLDIKKAEAQAREAQIETALERVRSKTMAMHNSDDVAGTVITLFDEVINLGLDHSIRCGIGILEGTDQMETWSVTFTTTGKVDLKMGMLNMAAHPILKAVKNAWKSGETSYAHEYKGKDVTTYYTALNNEPNYPFYVELNSLPDKMFTKSFFFSEGILFAHTENPISEEATDVLKRFTAVFGQTYRRYLDLLKAEAQAREAQIETALERVRSKSMAMHKSEELADLSLELVKQVQALGVATWFCAFNIYDDDSKGSLEWGSNGEGTFPKYRTPREGVFLRYYKAG